MGQLSKQLSGHKTRRVHAAAFSPGAAQCPSVPLSCRGVEVRPPALVWALLAGPLGLVAAQVCRTLQQVKMAGKQELLALLTS